MAFWRREVSLPINIDMETLERVKAELLDIQITAKETLAEVQSATEKLKAVTREMNVTLGKIVAAKRL